LNGKIVGNGNPTFIIAEAGINHNNDLNLAKKMIDVASKAGVDAVKFQVFRADKMYPKTAGRLFYVKEKKSIYEIVKNLELPYEWIPILMKYCEKKGLIFLSSVCDEESADKLADYGVEAFKITSYELTHHPLLIHIAKKGKPIIMSTGVSSLSDVGESINIIRKEGNDKIILMHCVGSYPTKLKDINLNIIGNMIKKFQVPVGLSDHTMDSIAAPIVAVASGATIIEKHFTLNKNLPGPDQKFAIEPIELKNMVSYIRNIEKTKNKIKECEKILGQKTVKMILGSSNKKVLKCEMPLYNFSRRRIFAIKKIPKNSLLTKDNVAVLRCGGDIKGLEPKYFENIIGKKVKVDLKPYEEITFEKIKN
jgi:N-acetylneuraminate synthase